MEEDNVDPPESAQSLTTTLSRPTYRDVLRRSRRQRNKQSQSEKESLDMDELVEVDHQLALLQAEVTKLTQRRARLIRRPQRQQPPQQGHSNQTRFSPSSLTTAKPVSSALNHQDLLHFVVQQLQQLVSVLAAQLHYA